ncbi:MAG: adenosine deaminase [Planctomycetota bacterium]|nr:adenosine deaminase [Planctomycetota bacterium]
MKDMKQDTKLSEELLRRLPKVALHEHLDGCLRPTTILELAEQINYDGLPESDPDKLGQWFARGANRGSLPEYLEGFAHTIAVMQTAEALERIAYEFLEDQKNDGVVYAEVRFAPHFHTGGELGLDAVMRAVLEGLNRGKRDHDVGFGLIVCAMRNGEAAFSEDMAELAVSYRNAGCVGFDLAGEEAGNPAKVHVDAFQHVKRQNFNITIHAGESFGPASIWQALQYCGAHRIGHGTRIIEDIVIFEGKVIQVGDLAQYIIDHRIPLEICLSSNVHTGAAASLAEHPFPILHELGFRLTLNTDNRLMSATTMTKEYALAVEHYGLGLDDLETISLNSMKSAFANYDKRCNFIFDRIKKPFRELRKELGLESRKPYGSGN